MSYHYNHSMERTDRPTGGAPDPADRTATGTADRRHVVVDLSPERALRALLGVCFTLVLLCAVTQVAYHAFPGIPGVGVITDRLSLNSEKSLPTAWAFLQLVIAAGCTLFVARLAARQGATWVAHWHVTALLLLLVGFEELLALHEDLNDHLAAGDHIGGRYPWVIGGAVLVVALALAMARFVFALPRAVRNLVVLAAAMFVGGAVAMEAFGGWYAEAHGDDSLGAIVGWIIEEGLELTSVSIMTYAVLRFADRHLAPTTVVVHIGASASG